MAVPHKPELGYTSERRHYACGYEIRTNIYRVVRSRLSYSPWEPKQTWDVFKDGAFQLAATSLRLAETYIATKIREALDSPPREPPPGRR
jgi:hypothetical protein